MIYRFPLHSRRKQVAAAVTVLDYGNHKAKNDNREYQGNGPRQYPTEG